MPHDNQVTILAFNPSENGLTIDPDRLNSKQIRALNNIYTRYPNMFAPAIHYLNRSAEQ